MTGVWNFGVRKGDFRVKKIIRERDPSLGIFEISGLASKRSRENHTSTHYDSRVED